METLYLNKTAELKRTKSNLEKEFDVKINIQGKKVTIDGKAINEFEATQVIEAIDFGFSTENALLLKDPNNAFRKIHIKEFTKRPLEDIQGRLIGKRGKTRKTLEQLSDTYIIINNGEVGIIGNIESIETAITAITNIIRGSKQTNAYKYLERVNRSKKEDIKQ